MQVSINRLTDFASDLEQELPKLSRDILDAATRIERLTFQVAALKTEVTILQKERSENGTNTKL
jgi:hypothetical protein